MAKVDNFERSLNCYQADEGGFHIAGDKPRYLVDRAFETEHIFIACEFDVPNKRVLGVVELTLVPYAEGLQEVRLDSEDTTIRKVSEGGRDLAFTHSGRDLLIDLGEPRRGVDKFKIKIEYVAEPQGGLYFTGADEFYPQKPTQIWTQGQDTDNHRWFPCVDEPKGRITSEIICTVPEKWTVVSNGRLVSTKSVRRGKAFHWLQDKPHSVYLITLVAGVFERKILQDRNPLVDFYCERGRGADGYRSFGNTADMLKLFADLTGEPYPWDKYSQIAVQDFIFGGMENTSATTQTDMTLHDETAHKDFSSDYLVAHEAAHQWFGDLITCREWPHGWLNESFATFLEARWQEAHLGRDDYLWDIFSMQKIYLGEEYRRPIVERKYTVPVDIFDRHLYEKGAIVLHMLRLELGEAAFDKAIKHYVKANRNRNVVTADLQRAIEEATGRNMDWFFDQWIFRAGQAEFQVDYAWDATAKQATFNVRQTQKEAFRCKVEIALLFDGERQTHTETISEKQQTLTYKLAHAPKAVQFDTGFGVLKTLEMKRPYEMLIFQLLNDSDVAGRIEAAQELGNHPNNKVVSALAEVLADAGEFYGVQITAAEALGKLRTPAARDALLAKCAIPHLKARRAVATALGNFKHQQAVADALIALMNSKDSYYVSGAAAASLGRLGLDGLHQTLKGALGRPSHLEAISAGALTGIGNIESDEAFNTICDWTEQGKPQRARVSATAALGSKVGQYKRRQAIEVLSDLLDDGWFQVRVAAIGALQTLEAREAISALRRLTHRELDGRVARMARRAIAAIQKEGTNTKKIGELQKELDELKDEHAKVLERLNKLEGSA